MFVYLFGLLIAASPWTGVWKITAETMQGGTETYYLVVQDEESAELYDDQWYPQLVKTFDVKDSSVISGITFEGVVVPTTLQGTLDAGKLVGAIIFNFPQYEFKSEFTAQKVVASPIQPPSRQIPQIIDGREINIVQYLADNAPEGDFEGFLNFWYEEALPRYFVVLEPLLSKDQSEAESELRRVYEALQVLKEKAEGQLSTASESAADYTVLLPSSTRRDPLIIEVYSEEKKWPPDYKPCCGDKLYNLKKFELLAVAP